MPRTRITQNLTITSTADATYPLMRALDDGVLNAATFAQQLDATAVTSLTATIRNTTQSKDMTAALDIKALAALGVATFTLTPANCRFKAGDLIVLVYDETGGTVTAPGECSIALDITQGTGPGAGFIGG